MNIIRLDADDQTYDSDLGLLEVFCVDSSVSMSKSQSLLSFFGPTKLETARAIITNFPVGIDKMLNQENHFSCLVTFNVSPEIKVQFARHDKAQIHAIVKALETVTYVKGTAIFDALRYCEKLIVKFIRENADYVTKWLILLHLFSDGEENSSQVSDPYEKQIEYLNSKDKTVHQRILYSFGDTFEKVKPLGDSLKASVIMVKSDHLSESIKDRDKIIFNCMPKPENIPKRRSVSFSYLKGDSPDLMHYYLQLQKADEVFQGKLIETEGLFRQNATFNVVQDTTLRFTHGKDTLDDYNDPITIGHTFKNSLRQVEVIPKNHQPRLLKAFKESTTEEEKIIALRKIIRTFPKLNINCLEIILRILNRVVRAQENCLEDKHKALSIPTISLLFCPILLQITIPDNPQIDSQDNLVVGQQLIEFMIRHRARLITNSTERMNTK
jgi:hypothetical protein